MKKNTNIYIFVVVMAVLALLAILFLVGGGISPKEHTNGRMTGILLRMFSYVESHNELPNDLHDLPPRPGYDNSVVDGWGNIILYITDTNENVTILSYGKDGKEGGSGEAADIKFTFDPYNIETYYNVIGVISPASFTKIKLDAIRDKLLEYTKNKRKLPAALEYLQVDKKVYSDYNKDSWGNKIIYNIENDTVTLKSFGKDGKDGGEGENADIIISFTIVVSEKVDFER